MVKKLFGLASVTVLAGFVVAVSAAGCSSKLYIYGDDGGLEGGRLPKPGEPGYVPPYTDGGFTDAKKHPTPPEEEDADVPGGSCPSTDPISAADIDAQLNWQPPAAFQNVCTQADIDALKMLFKNVPSSGVKFTDIKSTLGATCAGCAFSPLKGATWQVFVEDGAGAINNGTGSCFAQRSGNACGQARFRWETCLDVACPETDCGAGGVQACLAKAQKGACTALTAAYASACPNEATDIVPCGNLFGDIATSCSGGPTNTINITP